MRVSSQAPPETEKELSGYYEWQTTAGGKQPWYFTAADASRLLTVAGLWDEWKDRATSEPLKSCTMIITEPKDFVAEVHDRVRVLLTEDQFAPWAQRRGGNGSVETSAQQLPATLASVEAGQGSKVDTDDATLIEQVEMMRVE
jgi:putative SOS response-associated peptidase YedK